MGNHDTGIYLPPYPSLLILLLIGHLKARSAWGMEMSLGVGMPIVAFACCAAFLAWLCFLGQLP